LEFTQHQMQVKRGRMCEALWPGFQLCARMARAATTSTQRAAALLVALTHVQLLVLPPPSPRRRLRPAAAFAPPPPSPRRCSMALVPANSLFGRWHCHRKEYITWNSVPMLVWLMRHTCTDAVQYSTLALERHWHICLMPYSSSPPPLASTEAKAVGEQSREVSWTYRGICKRERQA